MNKAVDFIKNYFRNLDWRLVVLMLVGNVFLGIGVGTLKLSGLGNDAFSGMVMSLAACTGITYANFAVIVNLVLFVFQILFGRHLIGIGSVVNAFGLAYIATFFYNLFEGIFGQPETLGFQLLAVVISAVSIGLGLSFYQKADLGVAPYDSLALIFDGWFKKVPYFWCRMFTDITCAVICYVSGGIVGIGMAVCMFGLGPIVDFFNHILTNHLIEKWSRA